ncbi:unnamed protein product [Umbelopsis sp. WA50703]
MSVQTLYQKATRAYLLTQHVSALHSCVKAISLMTASGSDNIASLRRMIYVLFVNIVTSLAESKDLPTVFRLLGLKGTSKDDLVRLVWEKVLEGYSQVAGNVDGSVISVCLLMALRLNAPKIGRQIAEEWLADIPDSLHADLEVAGPMTESTILSNEDDESPVTTYFEVLELYSTNILTAMQDYSSAREFIKYNPYLSDSQKENFDRRIKQKEHEIVQEIHKKQEEARKAAEAAEAAAIAAADAAKAAEAEMQRQQQQQKATAESHTQSQSVQELKTKPTKGFTNGHVKSTPVSRTMTRVEQLSNTWLEKMKQISINSTSVAYILFVLLIVGLVRSQRTRMRAALELAASKLWATLRMGTKVTYV